MIGLTDEQSITLFICALVAMPYAIYLFMKYTLGDAFEIVLNTKRDEFDLMRLRRARSLDANHRQAVEQSIITAIEQRRKHMADPLRHAPAFLKSIRDKATSK